MKSLFRRSSSNSSTKSSVSSLSNARDDKRTKSKTSPLSKTTKSSLGNITVYEEHEDLPQLPIIPLVAESQSRSPEQTPNTSLDTPDVTPLEKLGNPVVSVQAPTPDLLTATTKADAAEQPASNQRRPASPVAAEADLDLLELPQSQSTEHTNTASSIAQAELDRPKTQAGQSGYFGGSTTSGMSFRKIWVKRAGASATLVPIQEDDLVDDVRDRILKKYGNSLGRSFDAPDVTLRILPRDTPTLVRHPPQERTLGPEEPMMNVLNSYFPSGQKVENALIIDVPRRTPRHSPRPAPYYMENSSRPVESGSEYFPIIPVAQTSPHLPASLLISSGHAQSLHHPPPHSMSVINTGHVPLLPSPGAARSARNIHRPRLPRTHTTSPSILNGTAGPQLHDPQKPHLNGVPSAPPLPTPPLPTDVPHRIATPPPRSSSPRPKAAYKLSRKPKTETPKLPTGLLVGAVPPINVLIVEDNVINLRLLEAFMKRLKVRWQTAMNGREAVTKWRGGGFHLVLMDIQLPVMNGLDATRAIRRMERVNNIGVFSSSSATTPTAFGNAVIGAEGKESGETEKVEAEDTLVNSGLFKSPVIIVALTASSLQSDRHEALAAGCNDFLTKPVSYIWLERKVMEWGCMQALIDFDGWRKWKDLSNPAKGTSSDADPPHKAKNSSTLLKAAQKESAGIHTAATAAGAPIAEMTSWKDKRLSVAEGGSGSGTGSGSEIESGDGGIVAGA